ncbi:MAG: hypothetical protein CMO01_00360 [Thalassobius sp.]|nr:hypothetical protein [Thalassovita sp.]
MRKVILSSFSLDVRAFSPILSVAPGHGEDASGGAGDLVDVGKAVCGGTLRAVLAPEIGGLGREGVRD